MELSSANKKKLLILLIKSFSHISGNGKPAKILYLLGNFYTFITFILLYILISVNNMDKCLIFFIIVVTNEIFNK